MDVNKIDICLVDGWHTYDCSIRDLRCFYELLADGGVLIVHDCLPHSELVASPTFIKDDWSGVTYKAFIDFVLTQHDLDYCAVDADYGCGIIIKNRTMNFMGDVSSVRKSTLASDWFSIHDDDKTAFMFFMQNHKHLLRLISAKTFIHGFRRTMFRGRFSSRNRHGHTVEPTPKAVSALGHWASSLSGLWKFKP